MTELEERARVVACARSWLSTPYHHRAMVKGSGVDCATLLLAVFEEAGLISGIELPYYPVDWALNRGEEVFLGLIQRYAHEIPGPPGPGDIVLWKFGRVFSHGAIVVAWPQIIHAYTRRSCVEEDAEAAAWLRWMTENKADEGKPRPRRFFSHWA